MKLKLLQLNIQAGRKIDEVITFIKDEDFDIIHLQEVASGSVSKTGFDIFEHVKKNLVDYNGELAKSMEIVNSSGAAYMGNATFYKKSLVLNKKEIVWLKPFQEFKNPDQEDIEFIKNAPRNALAIQFYLEGKYLWVINTHLAWGPTPDDEPYKISQGLILFDYVKKLSSPFILSGDFNVTPDSQVVTTLDQIAFNHTKASGLTNTLNPDLHRVKKLFPSGLAVDYIYTSKNLEFEGFKLISMPDLSDHLGLSLEVIL